MNSNFSEPPDTPESPASFQKQAKRTRLHNARVLGGAIVLSILLVASALATLLVLDSTHPAAHASGGAPTPTPTASTPAPGQPQPRGSLYTATPGSLARVDLKTSEVTWTIQASAPIAPLVMGHTLFFENADSANPFLEAANAKTGAQIWRARYPGGFLLGSGNELYDSFCDPSATSDPCHLDGINASTGALLWSYDLPHGNAWIALQNGVLYGVSYTSYFALNASTGAAIWQKDLLNYQDQEANMTPVVSGNVLSFASCNTTKQSSGFPGCYLYAFNARTGEELWHMSTTSSLDATPAIMQGVVYAGAIDGTLYAVKEQDGTPLWNVNAGGTIGQVLSNAGTVYVETIGSDGQTFYVEAFNAATHALRWGPMSNTGQSRGATILLADRSPLSAGPASHPFVLDHGLIYLQNGPSAIAVLKATDGSQVTQYSVSGTAINGFTVAG